MTSRNNAASPEEAILGGYIRLAGCVSARPATLLDFHFTPGTPLRCYVCSVMVRSPAAACAAGWYYTPDLRKHLEDSFYCPPCAELERI